MASVESSDIQDEFSFMGEFFKLRKKYYRPENDNEEYWEQLVLEVNDLARKYNNDYFTQLLLVMVNDIDKRAGNHKGDGFEALYKRLRGTK